VPRAAIATKDTEVEVVGQSGENRCWSNDRCKAAWKQDADGLHIRAMFAQRMYTDCKWPNPIVIRITHAEAVPQAAAGVLKSQQVEQRLVKARKAK
jgi:alpha-L-fucosidase